LDSQVEALAKFLLSESDPAASENGPLPVLPTQENRERVDPESAIENTGIYRDPWERRLRPLDETDLRTRDVVDIFNFLSKQEWGEASRRAMEEREERGAPW
jgi:hypothetical protein